MNSRFLGCRLGMTLRHSFESRCVTIRHPGQACSPAESPFQPESLKRGASRDPEVREIMPFPWIPDLAVLRVARPE